MSTCTDHRKGCLLGHPYVADSCVVGTPDDYNGELPLAFVVINNEAKIRIANDTRIANVIKANIMKVRYIFADHGQYS